jgi:hypothetical protein
MEQLFKALEKRAIHFPEQDALISSNGTTQTIITNQQLLDNITRMASFLKMKVFNA